MATENRRFSLEEDFMNFKTDDLLFGFMRCLSTARPVYEDGQKKVNENGNEVYEEYLTKLNFQKKKKTIAGICGCSVKTINRHIDDLIASGLIKEVIEDGKTIYLFPYDESGKYEIAEKDMIAYLIDTRNTYCIKIYLYLLNKYKWKGNNYTFTINELKKALGYSENTKGIIETTINNILDSLAREGVICFENSYTDIEQYGKIITIPIKELKFVAKSVNELRRI